MGIDIRLPQITGQSEREQLTQVKSYLYQLANQLQWALKNIDTTATVVQSPLPRSLLPSNEAPTIDAAATFGSIKSLIIKSADIVDAYYEEINRKLEGAYVAQSDFGAFVEKTSQTIEENSTSTTQRFENIQLIITDHDSNISSIVGELNTIGEDLSYKQSELIKINNNIESLDSSIAFVEGEVGELDESLQNTKTELSSSIINTKEELSGSINGAKNELSSTINNTKEELVGNINSVKTNLEGSIDSTKEELTGSIDNAKTELEGSIDSAKSELTGMVDEVDSDLQNTKTDVNGRIDDTNGSVAGLGAGLNDANSKIADVDEDLQDSKAEINNSIQDVQESVTGVNALLEDAKAQLQGSLDDLEVYVTGLQNVIIGVTAYLKSGLLYYTDAGIPVYGLEIGQTVKDEVAGTEVFNKYARFTSEKLSFYDNNGSEVAYISDKKLYIRIAEITVAFKIGGLMDLVMANGDVVTKWVGG